LVPEPIALSIVAFPSRHGLLLELLQDFDDGVALEAARGLARLKVREAREAILARFAQRMAKRGQGEFRKMVEKVVARLDR